MTAVCSRGHTSSASDYCDVCGVRIDGAAQPAVAQPAVAQPAVAQPAVAQPSGAGQAGANPVGAAPVGSARVCPACGASNGLATRYCEECGANLDASPAVSASSASASPASSTKGPDLGGADAGGAGGGDRNAATALPAVATPVSLRWEAVATADRGYFERMESEGVSFPTVYLDRRFALRGDRVAIGRRSTSKGLEPEIDLSAAPEDIGVSHQHAVLVADGDGGWSVVDPGSTNGTYLNDSTDPLQIDRPTPLHDGDRLHVGAWTSITLRLIT